MFEFCRYNIVCDNGNGFCRVWFCLRVWSGEYRIRFRVLSICRNIF